MARDILRGEIWMHSFGPPDKKRPVLVLSRPSLLRVLSQITVASITSTIRGSRVEILVGPEEGLKHVSAVNLTNLHTVAKGDLREYRGTVSPDKMREICRALIQAVGCDG